MWAADMVKRKGKHPINALSAIQVRNEKRPGRYADGNGLYLVVDASGVKRWLLRMVVKGKRRDIGLGGASAVSLAGPGARSGDRQAAPRGPVAILSPRLGESGAFRPSQRRPAKCTSKACRRGDSACILAADLVSRAAHSRWHSG